MELEKASGQAARKLCAGSKKTDLMPNALACPKPGRSEHAGQLPKGNTSLKYSEGHRAQRSPVGSILAIRFTSRTSDEADL